MKDVVENGTFVVEENLGKKEKVWVPLYKFKKLAVNLEEFEEVRFFVSFLLSIVQFF